MAANVFIEDDDAVTEVKRRTLLDALEDRNRRLKKKSILHRMVVVSAMRPEKHKKIIGHYDKLLHDSQARLQCEMATGLLLLYRVHCVHVLEGPMELLIELCRDLRRDIQASKAGEPGNMDSAKILVVSHDIPVRLYNTWMYREIDIEAASMERGLQEDVEKAVIDVLVQLLNLGMYIKNSDVNAPLEVSNHVVSLLLPQQATINYLLTNDVTCIFSPEEYLRMYETPYDVTLLSDLVWPLSVRMFPYN